MVIISAAVMTKGGKLLLARQFQEISRVRIEGLLNAFPKLIKSQNQQQSGQQQQPQGQYQLAHQDKTFVETDAIRYLFQPMEQLYLLLITTRSSNIVDDLDTLQALFRAVRIAAEKKNTGTFLNIYFFKTKFGSPYNYTFIIYIYNVYVHYVKSVCCNLLL